MARNGNRCQQGGDRGHTKCSYVASLKLQLRTWLSALSTRELGELGEPREPREPREHKRTQGAKGAPESTEGRGRGGLWSGTVR